jgi:hypothetical protein
MTREPIVHPLAHGYPDRAAPQSGNADQRFAVSLQPLHIFNNTEYRARIRHHVWIPWHCYTCPLHGCLFPDASLESPEPPTAPLKISTSRDRSALIGAKQGLDAPNHDQISHRLCLCHHEIGALFKSILGHSRLVGSIECRLYRVG